MGAERRADVDAAEKLLRLASESDGSASEAALPSRGRVGVSALLRNFARTGGVAPLLTLSSSDFMKMRTAVGLFTVCAIFLLRTISSGASTAANVV